MISKEEIEKELSYGRYIPFYVRVNKGYKLDMEELVVLSPYKLYVVYNIVLGSDSIFYDIGSNILFRYDIFEKYLYFLPN